MDEPMQEVGVCTKEGLRESVWGPHTWFFDLGLSVNILAEKFAHLEKARVHCLERLLKEIRTLGSPIEAANNCDRVHCVEECTPRALSTAAHLQICKHVGKLIIGKLVVFVADLVLIVPRYLKEHWREVIFDRACRSHRPGHHTSASTCFSPCRASDSFACNSSRETRAASRTIFCNSMIFATEGTFSRTT